MGQPNNSRPRGQSYFGLGYFTGKYRMLDAEAWAAFHGVSSTERGSNIHRILVAGGGAVADGMAASISQQ